MSVEDDLPEGVKKAIQDLLNALSYLSPGQIIDLLVEMLGEDIFDELVDMILVDQDISSVLNDPVIPELEDILDHIDSGFYHEQEEIEPYYEISHHDSQGGEIIIEMPVSDDDCIEWYLFDNEIYIHSINDIQIYKLIIPLPEFYLVDEHNVRYLNGLFIIPFSID